MNQADIALLLLETSVSEWNALAEQQHESSLNYGITAANDRAWALSSVGLNAGLARAEELNTFLRASRQKSLVEVIGRKSIARSGPGPGPGSGSEGDAEEIGAEVSVAAPELDESLLFAPDAAVRILEFLLEVAEAGERRALLAEAFVPPSDAGAAEAEGEEEDLLFTTPLRLLQAVDLEIKRAVRAREGAVGGRLLAGEAGAGAEGEGGPPSAEAWAGMGREDRLRVLRRETWDFCL